MLSIKVRDVLERARFFLNDVNEQYFTNDVLLAPFKVAYDDLKEELYDNDITIDSEETGIINITTSMRDIGGPTGPPLPVNFVVPLTLWERIGGSEDGYAQMMQVRHLPKNDVITSYLGYWAYRKQVIHLVGATTVREVKIDYLGDDISFTVNAEAQINLFNAKSFLSYRCGALAAKFYGENDAKSSELNGFAQSAIDKLLNTDVKNQQSMPVRRRPFMANYRGRNSSNMR